MNRFLGASLATVCVLTCAAAYPDSPSTTQRFYRVPSCTPRRSATARRLCFCTAGCCSLITTSQRDRKSTRLNSSHGYISYAVFCLKKKKTFGLLLFLLRLTFLPS